MNLRLITPLLALLFVLPLRAQTQPSVPVPVHFQSDASVVLTPDFVRDSDFIDVADISPDRDDPSRLLLGHPTRGAEYIRGWHNMAGVGVILPSGEGDASRLHTRYLLFGRYDPAARKIVLLARLDATDDNVAKARALEGANRRLKVSFSSDKPQYGLNEPIVLKWEVENTSPTPQKFYTGPYALQWEAIFDNRSHSTGTGGSHTRKVQDYVELAPGQKWSQTRTLTDPLPQGAVEIRMTLDSSDNFLGFDLSGAQLKEREARERVPGVVLFKEESSFSVLIKAPDAQTQAALAQKLSSPNWAEAYAAAKTLSQVDDAANFPEVKRLAHHSWPMMRILAAQTLSKNATTFTPELRALLFDPNARVRSEVLELIRRRNIGGAGLSILAMQIVDNEAVEKKIAVDRTSSAVEMAISYTLDTNRDIGNLLASRIENGHAMANGIDAPRLLNFIAENFHTTQLRMDKPATPEETAAILAAWKKLAAQAQDALKPHTQAELDTEVKVARTAMYGDFKMGAHFAEIVTHLQNLDGKFFPKPDNPDRQWFEALSADSRLDLLHALDWETGRTLMPLDNAPAWRALAQTEGPAKNEVFRFLVARIYNEQITDSPFPRNDNMPYFAPIVLAKLDFERARPHLQTALTAQQPRLQLGAAVGLLIGGDKSAMPLIFEENRWSELNWLDSEELEAALAKVTGLKFKDRNAWQKWWIETGKNQEWK